MMCKSHTGDKDNLNLLTQLIALFTTLHYFLSNKSITNLASDRKEPVKNLSGIPFYHTRGKEPTKLNCQSFKGYSICCFSKGSHIYCRVSVTYYVC